MSDGEFVSSLLRRHAPAWVVLSGEDATVDFACEARLGLRDGDTSAYGLIVRPGTVQEIVRVEESEPRRLPTYCPDRHVWGPGGFCLGLPGEYPARPTTPNEAAAWWETLRGFLRLQDDVAYTRRWPASCAWPHLPVAVQADALLAAASQTTGLPVATLEAWSRVAFRQRSSGHHRIAGRRSRCPCGSGRQVRHCHEAALVALAAAAALREQANTLFWKTQAGRPCCGTLDACPLRDGDPKETT